MNADLMNKRMENWRAVVGYQNIANAFLYKNPDPNKSPLAATSYTIDASQLAELLEPDNLINIRITMGCTKKDLTNIEDTPIFTPIIGGIGNNREEQHFEMSFNRNGNGGLNWIGFIGGILSFAGPTKKIKLQEAQRYVNSWSGKMKPSDRDMNGIFKDQSGENQKLRDYTFDNVDTMSIKKFLKDAEEASLSFHLGLETLSVKEDNPFMFRTVLHISKKGEEEGTKNHEFYQLSSPCPPNCGTVLRKKPS